MKTKWYNVFALLVVAAVLLAACAAPTPELIEKEVVVEKLVIETVVVEKEVVVEKPVIETVIVEKEVVVEKVVTATPLPVPEVVEEEAEVVMGFPRRETVFANASPVGAPGDFNEWVGWKTRHRGTQQLLNEPLWTAAPAKGEIINALAASPPEYNEDFTQVTFRLREGMYWSDGVEFTADDVVFTIELIRATPGANYHTEMKEVESVYAPDSYTIVVELTEPNSRFHTYFLDRWGSLWIMPRHVFEQVEELIAFEYSQPLSLGPYVLHSYDPGGAWTAWERRDDWDRTPTGVLFGKPVPKYVVFRDYGVPSIRAMSFVRHELDIAGLTIPTLRATLDQSVYALPYRPEFPWVVDVDPCISGLGFNTLLPPFDNPEVRWALALAIDIVSYISVASDGAYPMSALMTPPVPLYVEEYFKPMEEWLKDFTLDLGDGETFKPYDPDAPLRQAEYAKWRGYAVPEDVEGIKATFGQGWWKYAPDVAARLLEKNGFTRDEDGKWLLPDGTPWRFTVLSITTVGDFQYQNTPAAVHEWRKFGIDVDMYPTEMEGALRRVGDFEVSSNHPAWEPWGAHVDLYRSFYGYSSAFLEPVLGEPHWGHYTRWTDPRMDQVVAELKLTDWGDTERIIQLGMEGLKIIVEEMPAIATYPAPHPQVFDTYYWTGWPSPANPYNIPFEHWPNFKYMLPFLEATGR